MCRKKIPSRPRRSSPRVPRPRSRPAPAPRASAPLTVFISYSHSDSEAKTMLCKHLSALVHDGLCRLWDDRQLPPGPWQGEIQGQLDDADIVLLLVSSDYISSKYCMDEALRALEREEAGECLVVPVIVRECDWTTLPWARLVSLPTGGRPILSHKWHSADEALTVVARSLRGWIGKKAA